MLYKKNETNRPVSPGRLRTSESVHSEVGCWVGGTTPNTKHNFDTLYTSKLSANYFFVQMAGLTYFDRFYVARWAVDQAQKALIPTTDPLPVRGSNHPSGSLNLQNIFLLMYGYKFWRTGSWDWQLHDGKIFKRRSGCLLGEAAFAA